MSNQTRRKGLTLLIVEGEKDEIILLKILSQAYPELKINFPESVIVYGTNIFALNQLLENHYGNSQ